MTPFAWHRLDREVDCSAVGALRQAVRRASIPFLLLVVAFLVGWQTPGPQADTQYVLGPQDVIVVTVLRHIEFSGEYVIPDSGNVDIAGAGGPIKIAGLNLDTASNVIRDRFKKRLRNPEVSVTLKVGRATGVAVFGDVKDPGPKPIRPGSHLTDAVAAAGGLIDGIRVADCTVTVIRANSNVRDAVSLQDVLTGDATKNLPIFAGDVISITAPDQIQVFVQGEVKSPGVYKFPAKSATVGQAITAAGGALDDADYRAVTVSPPNNAAPIPVDASPLVEGKTVIGPFLQAGDLVTVPKSTDKIGVFGAVNQANVYVIPAGKPITLAEGIALAKGQTKNARLGKVLVSHPSSATQPLSQVPHHIFDLSKFEKNGDITQNPILVPGDVVWVPESPGHVDWTQALSAAVQGAIIYQVVK